MHPQSSTDHLGSYSAAIQTALATHLPTGTPVPSNVSPHIDNTGSWTAPVSCTKLGAPCYLARVEYSVAPLTSTLWMSVTRPSCHGHECLQSLQMSTAGHKSPLGEALILRPWRRKAKGPCPAPRLWRRAVTVHKLFWVRITPARPPRERLCAAAVLCWSCRSNQSHTSPGTDEPLVTLRGKLVPMTVSS